MLPIFDQGTLKRARQLASLAVGVSNFGWSYLSLNNILELIIQAGLDLYFNPKMVFLDFMGYSSKRTLNFYREYNF